MCAVTWTASSPGWCPTGMRCSATRTKGLTTCQPTCAALTAVQLSIPLQRGRLVLGTWQGIYLWEHRMHAHRREVALHLLGE